VTFGAESLLGTNLTWRVTLADVRFRAESGPNPGLSPASVFDPPQTSLPEFTVMHKAAFPAAV